jgi:ATP-binding cassette subfamily F protein 3
MTVLTANGISQAFGPLDLFGGVSVSIPPGGRIGLVGPNGVGKTSLLLILAGQSSPTSGTVSYAKGIRIGFLPQEAEGAFKNVERSVRDEMLEAIGDVLDMEDRLRALEQQMEHQGDDEELLQRYGSLQERFEMRGGYEYEHRIGRVLAGLGFAEADADMPVAHLSGGQKTRALLAQLLLSQPDLLILDEPTNHLDIAALEWLEGLLSAWDGALLTVSHDRYFLDRVVDTVWEMRPSGIEVFRGNYTAYVQQRGDRWERRRKEFSALKERYEKEIDFIKRNIASQRTAMAQGKLARLGREVEAIHAGGVEAQRAIESKGWLQATANLDMRRPGSTVSEVERRVKELRLETEDPLAIQLQLHPRRRGGDFVLRTKRLKVGYPGKMLFESDDIELMRGERAALMGGNGTGKTTFLRTVLGDHPPLGGECRLGANLDVGYLAQAHDKLDPNRTVLEEMMDRGSFLTAEARSYLAQFLFRGDDVYKKIGALSGGERGRLALAILATEGSNTLLLDEPTNHLDIPSQEVLQMVLERFQGTILLVSHDRYLIDRLATQVWSLSDGRLTVHSGGYREYLAQSATVDEEPGGAEADGGGEGPVRKAAEQPRTVEGLSGDKRDSSTDEAAPRLSKNEQRRLAERRAALEVRIAAKESELSRLADDLQSASEDGEVDRVRRLSDAYEQLLLEIEDDYESWSALEG